MKKPNSSSQSQVFKLLSQLNSNQVSITPLKDSKNNTKIYSAEETNTLFHFLQNQHITELEKISICLDIINSISEIHSKEIVHKSLSPHNILVNLLTKNIKLCHFDLSIVGLKHEYVSHYHNSEIKHENIYCIAPELTGETPRSADYRSDYYSLGHIIYYVFYGHFAFDFSSEEEIIYHHLKSEISFKPTQNKLNSHFNAIISKLTQKNPEDRYQSLVGIRYDVEKIKKLYMTHSLSEEIFNLGENDQYLRFEYSQKIYGRENEIKLLTNIFDNINQNTSSIITVSGYSGIGKTSIIYEASISRLKTHSFFIQSKFDQFKKNQPYFAFVKAFDELLKQLQLRPEHEITIINRKIQLILKDNPDVFTDFFPSFKKFLKNNKPVPASVLSIIERSIIFKKMFMSILKIFAQQTHPLIIFFDDVQWSDLSSLQLIEEIFIHHRIKNILIITAHRDNEINQSHPFTGLIQKLDKHHIETHKIQLLPLQSKHIYEMVKDSLHAGHEDTFICSELIFKRSHGNPFFSIQIFKNFYDQGCFKINHKTGRWQFDLEKMRQLEFADNVVDLMINKFKTLPTDTQELLKIASCLGAFFSIKHLMQISNYSAQQSMAKLWSCIEDHYLIPIEPLYLEFINNPQSFDNIIKNENMHFKFAHDRIQQAAYQLIKPEFLKFIHLKIARIKNFEQSFLFENTNNNYYEFSENSDLLFEITNHYNRALDILDLDNEKEIVLNYNLLSAEITRKNNAHLFAVQYYKNALSLLNPKGWSNKYHQIVLSHLGLMESLYLTGSFEEAIQIGKNIISHSNDKIDICKTYALWLQVIISQGTHIQESKIIAHQILNHLGEHIPNETLEFDQYIQTLKAQIDQFLKEKPVAELYHLPHIQNKEKTSYLDLLVQIWLAGYFTGDQKLIKYSILNLVLTSIKYGDKDASSFGYVQYGVWLRLHGDHQNALEFGQLAVKVAEEKYANPTYILRVGNIFAQALNPYYNHLESNLKYFNQSFMIAPQTGDIIYGVWSAFFKLMTMLQKGDPIDQILLEYHQVKDFVHEVKDQNMILATETLAQSVKSFISQTHALGSLNSTSYDEETVIQKFIDSNFIYAQSWFGILTSQARYIANSSPEEVLKYADYTEKALPFDDGFFPTVNHFFIQSLALTEKILKLKLIAKTPDDELIILKRNKYKLEQFGLNKDINFKHKSLGEIPNLVES